MKINAPHSKTAFFYTGGENSGWPSGTVKEKVTIQKCERIKFADA